MCKDFSVSMCVYGGDNPEWFCSAVDSILDQTLPPTEIVLVVDGPIPETLNIAINKYKENPIFNVYRLKENQGHGKARRIGLNKCSCKYVALMDADDISTHDRFKLQMDKFIADASLDIVGGNMSEFIGSPENIVSRRIVPLTDEEIKDYMKHRCPMNQVTVMFKKDSVQKAGGYIDWYCEEDYYLWIRMYLKNMKFANCEENLVNVRTGVGQYQRRGGFKYFRSEARLQRYMLGKGVIGFTTYFINVMERFMVQVLLPNHLRGWIFQKFARKAIK